MTLNRATDESHLHNILAMKKIKPGAVGTLSLRNVPLVFLIYYSAINLLENSNLVWCLIVIMGMARTINVKAVSVIFEAASNSLASCDGNLAAILASTATQTTDTTERRQRVTLVATKDKNVSREIRMSRE